jgi:hypothetical protein
MLSLGQRDLCCRSLMITFFLRIPLSRNLPRLPLLLHHLQYRHFQLRHPLHHPLHHQVRVQSNQVHLNLNHGIQHGIIMWVMSLVIKEKVINVPLLIKLKPTGLHLRRYRCGSNSLLNLQTICGHTMELYAVIASSKKIFELYLVASEG